MDNAMTPAIVRAFDELAHDVATAREFEDLLTQRLLNNVRTMKRRVATGLAHPEILTAVAWCNLTTRSVFHRLYEKEERRIDEMTGRITDLERELTRGGDDAAAPPDEFRRFRDSRIRFDRQAMDLNLRAEHVVELKRAIGDVLNKFDISGLAAADIDDALELVEEVEPDGRDEAFWKASLDRLISAVELYDDGVGPLRTNLAGLAHLKLETWELAAARRSVSNKSSPPSELDGLILRAAGLRIKAQSEAEELEALGDQGAPAELVKAARGTLARAAQIDKSLIQVVESVDADRSAQEVRWWNRTRFRLLRATAGLWLALDAAQTSRMT
jgi:hypothetical protein